MSSLKSIAAFFVALWYLFATVGFDIHRSSDSGDAYIVPLLQDISCGSIHPEAPCCHEHHEDCDGHDGCDDDEDCCSDTLERLSSVCDVSSSTQAPAPLALQACTVPLTGDRTAFCADTRACFTELPPRAGPPDSVHLLFCVFRS